MFADAVENGFVHACVNSPSGLPSSLERRCEVDGSIPDGHRGSGKLLLSALQRVDAIHLLPCHMKYSGLASVAELFKPTRVSPVTVWGEAAAGLEVLLHGRCLRGKQERLASDNLVSSSSAIAAHTLHGFVVAAQETTCSLVDLRRNFSLAAAADSAPDNGCVETEEPPTAVTSLRPLAEFDKIWFVFTHTTTKTCSLCAEPFAIELQAHLSLSETHFVLPS